jgi:hypothetical protein
MKERFLFPKVQNAEPRLEGSYKPSDLPEEIDRALWKKGYHSVSSRNSISLEEARVILGLTPEPPLIISEPSIAEKENKEPSNEDGEMAEELSPKPPSDLEAEGVIDLDPFSASAKSKRTRKKKVTPEKTEPTITSKKTEQETTENKSESIETSKLAPSRDKYITAYQEWQAFKNKKGFWSKTGDLTRKAFHNLGVTDQTEHLTEKEKHEEEEEKLSLVAAEIHSEYQKILSESFEKDLVAARERFMKEFGVEPTAENLAESRADLINKYIFEEADILEKLKIENWPPKEKGWWETTLESYSKQPKAVRFALSAFIGTAVVTTFSTAAIAGATGVLGIGAFKMARSAFGYTVGRGVSKLTNILFEKAKEKDVSKHEKEIFSSEEEFFDIANRHQKFLEKQKKLEAWKKTEQIIFGIGVGVGVSDALAYGENFTETSLGLKTDKIIDGQLIHPEPKNNLPGYDKSGENIPVPEVELNYESPIDAEQLERLTVRPGEGFWQPVSRELEFRIQANPEKYGLSAEDLVDESKLAKAVAQETNHILRSNGALETYGEVRIGQAGSIVSLSEDGKLGISENAEIYSKTFFDQDLSNTPKNQLSVTDHSVSELGEESIPVESPHFSSGQNFAENLTDSETRISGESTEPWLTNGLRVHETWDVLGKKIEVVEGQMDDNFFEKIEHATLADLEKQNYLFGEDGQITSELSKFKDFSDLIEQDGLSLPIKHQELLENLQEKLDKFAEIKTTRLEQFEGFQKSLPANYTPNSQWTVKDFLEREASVYKIPGQSNGDALESFVNSCSPSSAELNMTLKEFFASRLNDSGFHHTAPIPFETNIVMPNVPSAGISEVVKAHAEINVVNVEMPTYLETLKTGLADGTKSSLAEFDKFFIKSPEFSMLKEDVTNLCDVAEAKIKILEASGWKINPELKDSITTAREQLKEIAELEYKHTENWKGWLEDFGFTNEHDYITHILEAKDSLGQPVTIDLGSVLDMPKLYTPSQMGRFSEFVDKVSELTKDLSPEELAEVRKLPVDQFIKQNIKL